MTPTVAVLIPNYNHAAFLLDALDAVATQSLKPSEVIVIDDGSTDESLNLLQGWSRIHNQIQIYRNEQNMGVIYTHNRLLKLASSEYVCFLGADDKPCPELLEKSVELLAQHPKAGLCSGLSRVIDEVGADKGVFRSPIISAECRYLAPNEVLAALYAHDSWFMGNTTIYRRQCLLDVGGFDPELHASFDGFVSLILALKHGACFIPEPLSSWRQMDTGYAATYDRDAERKLRTLGHAKNLMITTHKDIVPLDYVIFWERRKLLDWELTRVVNLSAKRVQCLKGTLGSASVIGRVSYTLAAVVLRLILSLQKLYILIRYRQSVYPILLRKVKRLVMS